MYVNNDLTKIQLQLRMNQISIYEKELRLTNPNGRIKGFIACLKNTQSFKSYIP